MIAGTNGRRTRLSRVFAASILAFFASSLRAEPKEMTWQDVLRLAEQNSPALSASKQREAEAEYAIGVSRAGYLPTIQWDEMDSSRFPESSETLGIGGLIGSPYRSGRVSAGVATGTLWDFGRTRYGVREAKETLQFRKEDTRVTRYAVQESALFAFFECSRDRSQAESWEQLAEQAKLVAKEINHFVKTGQRSVVHRMLADAQSEEAEVEEAGFRARWQDARNRLSIWTGVPAGDIACPELPAADDGLPAPSTGATISPLISRAMAEAESAHSHVSRAKSDYWPRLVAAASAGNLQAAGVRDRGAYAFAGGAVIPLFDGMRTPNQVWLAEAQAAEKDHEVDAAKQKVADLSANYDEAFNTSKARLEHLEHRFNDAQDAFRVAKERYLSFQGDVTDLREALRNLAQTRTQIIDARTDLLKASGAKALLNGAY